MLLQLLLLLMMVVVVMVMMMMMISSAEPKRPYVTVEYEYEDDARERLTN